jgi:hypothetical protein
MDIETDDKVMTSAERQAKRQEKLRDAFKQCEKLQSDIRTITILLNSCVAHLRMIALDNDDNKSIMMVAHQIEEVLHVINADPTKLNKRRGDFPKMGKS